MITHAILRIEHYYGFLESPSCSLYCANLICVPGNYNKTFNLRLCRINHHFHCQVYIGTFLFKLDHPYKSISRHNTFLAQLFANGHKHFVLAEKAVNDFFILQYCARAPARRLELRAAQAEPGGLMFGIVPYQNCNCKRGETCWSFPYVSKRQEPRFLPALHRIAVAQRVVSNPSWGSAEL